MFSQIAELGGRPIHARTVMLALLVLLVALAAGSASWAQEAPSPTIIYMTDPEDVDKELSAKPQRFNLKTVTSASELPDICNAVLEHAANVYASEYSIDDQKAWVYAKKCGSSSSSKNVAINFVVSKLPVGFEAGGTDQAQWCNTNSSYRSRVAGYQRIENNVMATAIQNWGQCVEASQNNLHTRVNVSVTDRVFQFKIKNGTNTNQSITKLDVLSDEGGGITCDTSVPPSIEIRPNEWATIVCQRSFVNVLRRGTPYDLLPGGTIAFSNSVTPYFYSFKERFKRDAVPEPEVPTKLLVSLNGAHIGTRAYWSRGREHRIQYCAGDRLDQEKEGFDLVVLGTYEKPAWGRGQCAGPPFCDSAGEFCRELHYTNACYVNKAWHEWYKRESERLGLAYSKDTACANP